MGEGAAITEEKMPHKADCTILVVDDDELSRRMLARTLTSTGYDCAELASGLEAWRWIHEKLPSLLLLDLDMPDLNGAELLKRLRADPNPVVAQLPVIMLTGHAGEESEVLSLEAGADDFVTKPINGAILQARIDTQLRLGAMRRQLENQNQQLEAWRSNLERDLEAARLTQQSLIPQKPLQLPGWEIATCFRPVIQVGGDIYGWLHMNDGRILFWIADAAGHGASAALLTTLTKLLFHHGSAEHGTPTEIMRAVHEDFRGIFGAHLFMTAMCVALEPATGRASVLGAGHPPLLVLRRNGEPELVWSNSPPLGLADPSQFVETTVELAAGDGFVLYTDGLFGGGKGQTSRLTPEILASKIESLCPTVETLLRQMLKEAAPDSGAEKLSDDVAAVAARRNA